MQDIRDHFSHLTSWGLRSLDPGATWSCSTRVQPYSWANFLSVKNQAAFSLGFLFRQRTSTHNQDFKIRTISYLLFFFFFFTSFNVLIHSNGSVELKRAYINFPCKNHNESFYFQQNHHTWFPSLCIATSESPNWSQQCTSFQNICTDSHLTKKNIEFQTFRLAQDWLSGIRWGTVRQPCTPQSFASTFFPCESHHQRCDRDGKAHADCLHLAAAEG